MIGVAGVVAEALAPTMAIEALSSVVGIRRPYRLAAALYTPGVNPIKCTQCGSVGLAAGFVADFGEGSRGFAQWISGSLERGVLGNAKIMGRPRLAISAYRCPQCSHLELFAA